MRNWRFYVWLPLLFVVGCSGQGSFRVATSKSITPTDLTLSPKKTQVIQPITPNAPANRLGLLSLENAKLDKKSDGTLALTGHAVLKDENSNIVEQHDVNLTGHWEEGVDHPVLESDDSSEKYPVRARLTCLSESTGADCDRVLIDVFMKSPYAKEIEAAQVLADIVGVESIKKDKVKVEAKESVSESKNDSAKASSPATAKKTETETEAAAAATSATTTASASAPAVDPKDDPATPTAEKKDDKITSDDGDEEEDPEEKEGLYVGTLYQDAGNLFLPKKDRPVVNNKPAESTPTHTRPNSPSQEKKYEDKNDDVTPPAVTSEKSRPVDQAVGQPFKGSLEKASTMIGLPGDFLLLNTERNRYYGTYEMVRMISRLAEATRNWGMGPLQVGDISQLHGGKLSHSKHVSHQTGIDADLGYPVDAAVQKSGFIALVDHGEVDHQLHIGDTWKLFKFIWSFNDSENNRTTHMDRIFVDSHIKKALCRAASSDLNGAKASSYAELLRRLRPAAGHHTHFHLRLKCSPFQPRCRMMGDPPSGSGC